MKRYIKASIQNKVRDEGHQAIVNAIAAYDEDEVVDVLYEQTPEGEYIYELMEPVESELELELLPSIQGGTGIMDIYDAKTDKLIKTVDYSKFNDDVINEFMTANTDDEFESNYMNMLRRIINR